MINRVELKEKINPFYSKMKSICFIDFEIQDAGYFGVSVMLKTNFLPYEFICELSSFHEKERINISISAENENIFILY